VEEILDNVVETRPPEMKVVMEYWLWDLCDGNKGHESKKMEPTLIYSNREPR